MENIQELASAYERVREIRCGGELREMREKRNMTLRELAEVLGCNYSYLSKIENGHKPMTMKMASRLTKAFVSQSDNF